MTDSTSSPSLLAEGGGGVYWKFHPSPLTFGSPGNQFLTLGYT